MATPIGYQKPSNIHDNDYITDPEIPDPENLPVPLGWNLLVRPYPIDQMTQGGIIISADGAESARNATNIARVVAIGPCAWNRAQHKSNGVYQPWVEVGEFISYPRYKGSMRNFKGVTFCILSDDDIVEKLPDPMVFGDDDIHNLNIPLSHLTKYKTIHNPDYMKGNS